MRQFKDRVAVITGAGSGIGRALALALAREGCHLVLAEWNADTLAETEALAAELGAAVTVSGHVVDVSDRAAMEAFAAGVAEAHPCVHLLVNNAGLTVAGSFREKTLDDWETVVGVNLWGVVYGCKLFLPLLEAADEAHVVNISSVFGIVGIPGQTAYCATKFAVRGLTEALWEEYRPTHVGFSVVHPGGVDTNIVHTSKHYQDDAEILERTKRRFKKMGITPDKAAATILRGVRKKKPRILVTKEAPWIDRMKRFFPVLGNKWIADGVVRAMGMRDEQQKQIAEVLAEIEEAQTEARRAAAG